MREFSGVDTLGGILVGSLGFMVISPREMCADLRTVLVIIKEKKGPSRGFPS